MEALQVASDWGMVNIELETDSTNLVKALNSSEFDLAPEGVLFREMRIYLRSNFNSFVVKFMSRTCNKAAHCLAAVGSDQDESRLLWPDSVPDAVIVVVASELAEPF
jgi:hypothetical protein